MATFTMTTLSTLPTLQVAGYIYSFVNLQGPESSTSQIDANLIRDTIMAAQMSQYNESGTFGGTINEMSTELDSVIVKLNNQPNLADLQQSLKRIRNILVSNLNNQGLRSS